MSTINPPPTRSPISKQGPSWSMSTIGLNAKPREDRKDNAQANSTITPEWQEFFSAIFMAIIALQQSGTTANRPIKGLYVGRPYFDTTLNRPIWYTGTNWIRADGVVV